MNKVKEYNISLHFKDNYMTVNDNKPIKLVKNDYNSVVFLFDSDIEDGRKVFELKKENKTVWIQDIIDNKVVLVAHDEDGNVVPVINQAGDYEFEVSIYQDNSKFTIEETGYIHARDEIVSDDDEVEKSDKLPILGNLINEVDTLKADCEETIDYASEKGAYASEMGDYAKEQGNQAKDLVDTYTDTLSAMQRDISSNTNNINTNTANITNLAGRVSTNETNMTAINNNLANYSLITETGSQLTLNLDSTNYKITALLKDKNGNTISTSNEIDLPLESVVVHGYYDNTNKKIVLELDNSSTIDIPVGDLINGLQSQITSTNKLDSDLIDDSASTNKFVTSIEKENWNNKSDFSGNYADLNNKPAIPTQLNQLADDSTHRLVSDTEKSVWNSKLEESDLADYVKNTDYANANKGGVVKVNSVNSGLNVSGSGLLYCTYVDYNVYLEKTDNFNISKGTLENVIAGKGLVNKEYVDGLVGDIATVLDEIQGEVI